MSDIVLFGITGDLARKRLIPAMARLYENGTLTEDSRFIAFGRRRFSPQEFQDFIITYAPIPAKEDFAAKWQYVQSELDQKTGYEELASILGERKTGKPKGKAPSVLIYVSLPPQYQQMIAKNLFAAKVMKKNDGRMIAIEKPFGDGSVGAKKFDEYLRLKLSENQIYRIDHYAGKQELMGIESRGREGMLNGLDSQSVASIAIHFDEKGTAKGRGAFYDHVGALNDVCQNHVLHMLATILAAPFAASSSYEKARAAAVSLLKPVGHPIFGQYESFRSEEGVSKVSTTETYFMTENVMSVAPKNADKMTKEMAKRWKGLKVTLSGGKGLAEDLVDICIEGKTGNKPAALIGADGTSMCIATSRHGSKDAYQTVFEAAIKGDMSRSIGTGQIVSGWKYVENVKKMKRDFRIYKEGSIL